jgi:hypothetical protein
MEVDFVINDMEFVIEAKASTNIHDGHLKNVREVIKDYPEIKKRVIVSLVERDRRTEDGIDIWNASNFIWRLWDDELFS